MHSFTITGNINLDELIQALRVQFASQSIIFTEKTPISFSSIEKNSLVVSPNNLKEINELNRKIDEQNNEIVELQETSNKALDSISTFHSEQQKLFDEFVFLRKRYDEQKTSLLHILWVNCASVHPDLSAIPLIEDDKNFDETELVVGDYNIGEKLGQGKFATVKVCYDNTIKVKKVLAIKIIKKDKITSFTGLKRLSNEIDILKSLNSPYIISLTNTIHTKSNFYIITEKGSSDLFDFFDENPEGVSEEWAKEIFLCLFKAVKYCHDNDICHRGKLFAL